MHARRKEDQSKNRGGSEFKRNTGMGRRTKIKEGKKEERWRVPKERAEKNQEKRDEKLK